MKKILHIHFVCELKYLIWVNFLAAYAIDGKVDTGKNISAH